MRKKLFNKLMDKKMNLYGTIALVLSKTLTFVIDVPFICLGIWMFQNGNSPAVVLAGAVITIAAGIVYVWLNVQKLVPWGCRLEDWLWNLFTPKRVAKFYDDMNHGRIRYSVR